jgi:hypothetical protein
MFQTQDPRAKIAVRSIFLDGFLFGSLLILLSFILFHPFHGAKIQKIPHGISPCAGFLSDGGGKNSHTRNHVKV